VRHQQQQQLQVQYNLGITRTWWQICTTGIRRRVDVARLFTTDRNIALNDTGARPDGSATLISPSWSFVSSGISSGQRSTWLDFSGEFKDVCPSFSSTELDEADNAIPTKAKTKDQPSLIIGNGTDRGTQVVGTRQRGGKNQTPVGYTGSGFLRVPKKK
jgi:hypothetical protein